jgi:hypothetical protein
MTERESFKVVTDEPLIGDEREWLPDMPNDNLVAALLLSAIEIGRLNDELSQIKSALAEAGIALPDRSAPIDAEERSAIEQDTAGPVVKRIMNELFRPQKGWTDVDPRVRDYLA